MSRIARTRKGFTLIEILVAVAILVIMAAMITPLVINQLRRGDIGRTVADITSIETGMEQFLVDVRRVPGDLTHLVNPIDTDDDDVNGNGYPQGLVNRWAGPYLSRDVTSDSIFPTGFGGEIQTEVGTDEEGGVTWAVITIRELLTGELESIDLEIDGEVGSSTGRLRWTGTDPATIATYRVMPVH